MVQMAAPAGRARGNGSRSRSANSGDRTTRLIGTSSLVPSDPLDAGRPDRTPGWGDYMPAENKKEYAERAGLDRLARRTPERPPGEPKGRVRSARSRPR